MATVQRVPTLDDVAARAGVSAATVSRFLNRPDVVAEATRERIGAAIAETGYVPNLNAGALASKRSRMIAALVPEIGQSLFNDTVQAMIEELAAGGNSVMLALTGYSNERFVAEIERALAWRVDAILLTGVVGDAEARNRLRESGVTVVETWGLPDEPIDVAVGFSDFAAGEALADFVHHRGYRRPHLVVPHSVRSEKRASAFAARWQALVGREPSRNLVAIPTHFGQGRLAFSAIRGLAELPDVAVCGSDLLAQGLIVEAQAGGLRVPQDLAVTGFGNLRIAGDMRPTITSVDIDGARIAREVMAVLRARASGEHTPHRVDVGFRIIARESA